MKKLEIGNKIFICLKNKGYLFRYIILDQLKKSRFSEINSKRNRKKRIEKFEKDNFRQGFNLKEGMKE